MVSSWLTVAGREIRGFLFIALRDELRLKIPEMVFMNVFLPSFPDLEDELVFDGDSSVDKMPSMYSISPLEELVE